VAVPGAFRLSSRRATKGPATTGEIASAWFSPVPRPRGRHSIRAIAAELGMHYREVWRQLDLAGVARRVEHDVRPVPFG